MKKLFLLLVPFTFVMCTNSSYNAEKISRQNDSLQRVVIEKDSALYAFINTFNSIETNLQTIKDKENIIRLNSAGTEHKNVNDINEDIKLIYDLMLQNKSQVSNLEQKLKAAGISNKNLKSAITNLKLKLQDKDTEILKMRDELKNLNIKVDELSYTIDTLNFINADRQRVIDNQDKDLHTAYYMFGSTKELKEAKIIDKKGLFSPKKINQNFDKDLFIKIDIREKTRFNINSKKIKILSVHPENSFTIIGKKPVEAIEINNPEEFWSVSKYLVIILD